MTRTESDDDDDSEHPFDRLVNPTGVVARYCNVQQEEFSGDEGELSGDEVVGSGRDCAVSIKTFSRRVCGCQ